MWGLNHILKFRIHETWAKILFIDVILASIAAVTPEQGGAVPGCEDYKRIAGISF